MKNRWVSLLLVIIVAAVVVPFPAFSSECLNWKSLHPEWIFCDDFESDASLVQDGRYFEYDNNNGDFVVMDNVGLNNSRGMRALWQAGEIGAGSIKLGYGRNPAPYMNTGVRPDEDFREIYYRMYVKMQKDWQGNPQKLSRVMIVTDSNWSEAMIAHLWGDSQDHLMIEPVRCVDENSQVKCIGYNDFPNMDWIGSQPGPTPIFDSAHSDKWYCIESHVRLNDPGTSNGVQEFWLDGTLEARSEGLDFVRSYTAYGINAIFIENYWNSGSPKDQERFFDHIIVSTQKIGCLEDSTPPVVPVPPSPPQNLRVVE